MFVSSSGLACEAGNYCCKLFFPARALEWIHTDFVTVTCEDAMLPEPPAAWSVPPVSAEQLGVTLVTTVTRGDVNKQAVAKALQLVSDKSRSRCELVGRRWCCKPDTTVVGNIGRLFLLWHFHVGGGAGLLGSDLTVPCGNHFQLDLPWQSSLQTSLASNGHGERQLHFPQQEQAPLHSLWHEPAQEPHLGEDDGGF